MQQAELAPERILWAGTERSFLDYLAQCAQVEALEARLLAAGQFGIDDDEEDEQPYLLSIENGVGLIQIAGPISPRDSWITRLLGMATYPAITAAVSYAAASPEVHHIVLDINSGGGTVAGVSDTGNHIAQVNDHVKPVLAFSDGGMLSAAYWLGAAAGNVFSSQTALIGSIGVLQLHMEYSKQLATNGVTATVLRAGKYKALANPYEPLSDLAKAEIQGQLDEAYQVFVAHVAAHRDQPYDVVDSTMAQGREFFGRQALDAGLVDGILSFDQLISMVHAQSA